jgi:hypothetical protein
MREGKTAPHAYGLDTNGVRAERAKPPFENLASASPVLVLEQHKGS